MYRRILYALAAMAMAMSLFALVMISSSSDVASAATIADPHTPDWSGLPPANTAGVPQVVAGVTFTVTSLVPDPYLVTITASGTCEVVGDGAGAPVSKTITIRGIAPGTCTLRSVCSGEASGASVAGAGRAALAGTASSSSSSASSVGTSTSLPRSSTSQPRSSTSRPSTPTTGPTTTPTTGPTTTGPTTTPTTVPDVLACVGSNNIDILVVASTPPEYVPVVPTRVLETRTIPGRGITSINYPAATTPKDGERVRFKVAGTVPVDGDRTRTVPLQAEAVVLNVTGVDVSADGFVTAWDCATDRPVVSNLNLTHLDPATTTGLIDPDARANLVVTRMDAEGYVCLYAQHATDLVADLNGYFPPGAPYAATVPPERVLETRPGEVGFINTKPLVGARVEVTLSSIEDTTKAVMLNITGVNTDASGFVTVWDCAGDPPATSNLNLLAGLHATPNLVVSRVGAGKKICLTTSVSTDLVVDLFGRFAAISKFTATAPIRVLETRTEDTTTATPTPVAQVNYRGGRPGAESVIRLQFPNAVGGPTAEPDAVVLNVTGTDPAGPGFVTIWPCAEQRPLASNVNMAQLGAQGTFPAVSNLVIAKTDITGSVCLFTQRGTHLVADLYGYFPLGAAG